MMPKASSLTRDHAAEHATRERVAREDGYPNYYAKRKALAEGRRAALPAGRRSRWQDVYSD